MLQLVLLLFHFSTLPCVYIFLASSLAGKRLNGRIMNRWTIHEASPLQRKQQMLHEIRSNTEKTRTGSSAQSVCIWVYKIINELTLWHICEKCTRLTHYGEPMHLQNFHIRGLLRISLIFHVVERGPPFYTKPLNPRTTWFSQMQFWSNLNAIQDLRLLF
jgi:hypothetical protein